MILTFESEREARGSIESIFPSPWQAFLPGFSGQSHQRLVLIKHREAVHKYWATLSHIDGKLEVDFTDVFQKRFEKIIELAGEFGEEIEVNCEGYAEPGYTTPDCGIICLANWNDKDRYDRYSKTRVVYDTTPSRIRKLLEKLGVEIEWSDEWERCEGCGKLIRMHADSMCWSPQYAVVGGCEVLCKKCIEEDPEEYFEEHQGNTTGLPCEIDPSEHGYSLIYDGVQSEREYIAKKLKESGVEDFLLTQSGACYVPDSYIGRVRELQALLENRELDLADYLSDLTDVLTKGHDE